MVFGMSLETFTLIHVLISLLGIGSGAVVMAAWLRNKRLDRWTAVFLATTLATSITGFGFPFARLLPSHILGLLSLLVLTVACLSLYRFHLKGLWRKAYLISASTAFYFNVFVLVIQSFRKIPAVAALAPSLTEPFLPVQLPLLGLFVVLTFAAVKKYKA
jgi:hypothetical protein